VEPLNSQSLKNPREAQAAMARNTLGAQSRNANSAIGTLGRPIADEEICRLLNDIDHAF